MMNNRIGEILLVIIISTSIVHGQFSDVKEYGYSGNIKSIISYRYDLIEEKEGKWVAINDDHFFSKQQRYFNQQGLIDSFIVFFNYEYVKKGRPMVFSGKNIYKYDSTGVKTGAMIGQYDQEEEKIKSISTYHWLTPYNYVETIKMDSSIKMETVYYLSKTFQDSMSIEKSFFGDSITSHVEEFRIYDLNHHLIEITTKNYIKEKVTVKRFENIVFDQSGNTIIIYQFNNDEKTPSCIFLRKIEYYE